MSLETMQSFIKIGGSVFEKSLDTRQTFVVLFIGFVPTKNIFACEN